MNAKLPAPLPREVIAKDLTAPKWNDPDNLDYGPGEDPIRSFELWYVERFGWVIPTLEISSGRHRYRPSSDTRRTYAIGVDGQSCRVGHGPHVKATVVVYVRKSRRAALQRLLDLYAQGLESANVTRDRISTRRMQGSMRRSWSW